MITDNSNGRLDELSSHSYKFGLVENFQEALKQLIKFSENGYDVTYKSDSTPLSIKFLITKGGKQTHSGGFIFTDPNGASEEEPSFIIYLLEEVDVSFAGEGMI